MSAVSLTKARVLGIEVREVCFSDAFREGQWIHRSGVLFAAPDLAGAIVELWPDVRVIKPLGVISDVPDVVN
jgi:hypothetical protein